MAYGADTRHILTKGLTAEINTNLIERFQGELKSRTKVMRGFKKFKSAQNTLNGWIIHYNFLRPHESLTDKTPAEMAGITYPYKTWLDVVNSQQGVIRKPEKITTRQTIPATKPRRRRKRWLPKTKISPETKPSIKTIRRLR